MCFILGSIIFLQNNNNNVSSSPGLSLSRSRKAFMAVSIAGGEGSFPKKDLFEFVQTFEGNG